MATIRFTSTGTFILGKAQLYATTEFSVTREAKLVEYNFPFSEGIDYEDNGEGKVEIRLKGMLLNYASIGDIALKDLNAIRAEFEQQKQTPAIKFAHPQIGAYNVKISNFTINQSGEKEGYMFDIQLLKITPIRESQIDQQVIEKNFEAAIPVSEGSFVVKAGDSLWSKAEELYGEGRLWRKIWEYGDNITTSQSKNPSLIFPGEVFKYAIL